LIVVGLGAILDIDTDDCNSPVQKSTDEEVNVSEEFHLSLSSPVPNKDVQWSRAEAEDADAEEDSLYFSNRQKINRFMTIDSDEDDIQMSLEAGEVAGICVGQSQNLDNIRKYDKQVACFFCDKLLHGKLKRHLQKIHSNEPEVAKLLALSSTEDSRKGFVELANRGNFKHNASVLSAKEGSLIVRRRPSNQTHKSDEYLPCQYCLGLFLKRDLWRHVGKCPFKTSSAALSNNTKNRSTVTAASRMLLEGATVSDQVIVSQPFQNDILDRMRFDRLTRRARNDIIIMKYGSSLYHRHGRQRVHDISQQMRQLARLLLEVRFEGEEADHQVTLERCLSGRHFDRVVEATERLCKREIDNDSGRPLFQKPSLGLKLGITLGNCADIKKGMAIRMGDKVMENEADAFLTLHKSDWKKISSASLASIKRRGYNNPDILPLTSDLVKLKEYQEKSLTTLTEMLKKDPTYSVWRQLLDIVYSRVVIFNKRRGGETSRLHLNAFLKRPKWQEVANDVLVKSLKPLEQKLLKR
jgi:hypothetical protein